MHKNNIIRPSKSFVSASFLSATFILFTAAFALRPGMYALSQYYNKQSIDIQCPLKNFDLSRLPSFSRGWEFSPFVTPQAEEFGTEEYVDLMLRKQPSDGHLIYAIFFTTYYNDPKDKVPHTPDVCSRQGGDIVTRMETITLDVPDMAPDNPMIQVRLLTLKNPKVNVLTLFLFVVEGKFCYTREQARWRLARPGNRYSYFSKIEVNAVYPLDEDPLQGLELLKSLLREALPILVADYYPTKQQLTHR